MNIIPKLRQARMVARKVKNTGTKLLQTPPKLKFYYGYFYKHCKVCQHRMLLESFHGKGISDSTYAVLQEIMDQGIAERYEIFYATDDVARDQPFVDANQLPVKLVDVNSRLYTYVLATARYLLNNSSFPAYFIRRPGQIYVQTWHGTPLKTLGKEMRLGIESMVNVQHNFLQANWLTFPNDFTRDAIMRDYNLDKLYTGDVAMVGYPRNSVFLKEADQDVRTKYQLDGYTTFAYMPTWRGTSNHSVEISTYADAVSAILDEIDSHMTDDQKMFVNFHSMVAASITLGSYEHIFPFPSDIGTYDFLSQIDVLVTDYSSVMFDFALTERPVILFTYDEERYLADRGLYFPLAELPFTQVKTTGELCRCMSDGSYAMSDEQLEDLRKRFLGYDTADNAKQVLSLLQGKIPQDVPIVRFRKNLLHRWNMVDVPVQKTRADLNGIFLSSNKEDDLVLLKRAGFGPVKSAHLYDNYRDYTFLFYTRTTPRTVVEEFTRRFWKPSFERVERRERLRLVADLDTAPEVRTTCLAGVADSSYSMELEVMLPVAWLVDGQRLYVGLAADGYEPLKLMLVSNYTIRWVRDLSDEERALGCAALDVTAPLIDPVFRANVNTRTKVCLLVRNLESGEQQVATLIPPESVGETSVAKRLSAPIIVSLDAMLALVSRNSAGQTEIPLLDKAHERNIDILPHVNMEGCLSLLFTYEAQGAQEYLHPLVTAATTPGQTTLKLTVRVPKGDYTIRGVEVRNRMATSSTRFATAYRVHERKNDYVVKTSFDPQGRTYDGIYWDLYLLVTERDGSQHDLVCFTSDAYRHSLFFRNLQCKLEDGNVLFPYTAARNKFALCHRPLDPSDTMITKVREWAAFGCYLALLPYWKSRHIWLVYEKFCSLAQDNGYAFFKYCMEDAPEEAKKHIYYVIKSYEPEAQKVASYGRNVVDFMSFRHMLYLLAADIYVGSDARTHLYQWRPKSSVIRKFIGSRDVFFLQHGVTAMKRVDYLFGMRGSNPMTYFLTTSHNEQEIVVNNFGYNLRHAPILGFSRWDLLKDTSNPAHRTILLMPTWRQWLEDVGDETFLASDYYAAYSRLISDERICALLHEAGITLKFFIHPKLSEQLRHFEQQDPSVQLIDMGSAPLNELIMECSALITDYSSVAWDVLYMDKPVLFYQFDQQMYLDEVGSYIDFDTQLPGPICKDLDTLVEALEELIAGGFELNAADKRMADGWFDFKDKHNRKRTYEYLLEEGY